MNPVPCWLAGAQHVALNMSNNDLALKMHFALFKSSEGFILKPEEMRISSPDPRLELWEAVKSGGVEMVRDSGTTPVSAGSTSANLSSSARAGDEFNRFQRAEGDEGRQTSPSEDEGRQTVSSVTDDEQRRSMLHGDSYWPPPRERLQLTSIQLLSLHNLPKVSPVVPLLPPQFL